MVSNSQAKFIKSLKIKKYRTRENCFLAEGKKNVLEAYNQRFHFKYLLATDAFILNNKLPVQLRNQAIVTTSDSLVELGTFQTNNDCLAVLEMPKYDGSLSLEGHIVVVDGLSDPGNLGTIVRTMDWFGYNELVCSTDSADFFNPKVINATMGSFTRVKVHYREIATFLSETPLEAYGADLNGISLKSWKPTKPIILVLGSESHGIRPEVARLLTEKITIPSFGQAESLNVGIAAGIMLNHLRA